MSPDQELYDRVFEISQSLGFDTYDYLPAEGTRYPFVYLGQTQEMPRAIKIAYTGEIAFTIHVYGELINRKLISEMKSQLIANIKQLNETSSFKWYYVDSSSQLTMMQEKESDTTSLWHAIVPVTLKYINKGAI